MDGYMQSLSASDNRRLREIFNDVKREVAISECEIKEKRRIVGGVLEHLKNLMMEAEPLFEIMFSEFAYTGSYFDGLRIKDANEFDINVVLKLPVRKDMIILDTSSGPSTYALLKLDFSNGDPIKRDLDHNLRNRFKANFLNSNNCVDPAKVLFWMQSVYNKAKSKFEHSRFPGVQSVGDSASGPAITLKIKLENQYETVDVDLVAVFRFEKNAWTEAYNSSFQKNILSLVPYARHRMYLVPKLLDSSDAGHSPLWRKHFMEVERELLNGKIAAKPVIRILKLLRDNCQWHSLASYYIKTLVMIEVVDNWRDSNYWNDIRLPQLIFKMLDILLECFQVGRLHHLLYRDFNLLDKRPEKELFNFYRGLRRIQNKMKLDMGNIKLIFLRPSTLGPQSMAIRQQSAEIIEEVNSDKDDGWSCNIL